jgi:hypothetical protein
MAEESHSMSDEPDLFRPAQLGLGLEDTRPDPTKIDPDEVRQELLALLAVARSSRETAPWDTRTQRYHRVVFPQMARWLPDDEAAQLCFEFAQELERIEALLAA